jgi:hypothetical protein
MVTLTAPKACCAIKQHINVTAVKPHGTILLILMKYLLRVFRRHLVFERNALRPAIWKMFLNSAKIPEKCQHGKFGLGERDRLGRSGPASRRAAFLRSGG